jgi:hypothetical protein
MDVHLQDWIEKSNAQTLSLIEWQGRTAPGVVPFVGAGLSMQFGFKSWSSLLLTAASPASHAEVKRRLDSQDYEGAAETLLKDLQPDGFQNMVATAAGDGNLAGKDFRAGSVSLLPLLAQGPVITTNFDRVLERAFAENGAPFESIISGPRPDLIVDALHGNRHVLIKLHGDWQDRVGRTFTASDYDTNYGVSKPRKKRELLEAVEELLFASRSLLFIGASLDTDRTTKVLEMVHGKYAGIRHYATMPAPTDEKDFAKKERQLGELGVLPIWYHPAAGGHAKAVEASLAQIVERISVQTLRPAGRFHPRPAALPDVPLSPPAADAADFESRLRRIVRLTEEGQLTFFLGSAIYSPTSFMAAAFYADLARLFACEALRIDHFAVAQYIADRHGREQLYGEIRRSMRQTVFTPRSTHALFANWRSYQDGSGKPLPYPLILTTNYDDAFEDAIDRAGLPYHLLTYQASGPHRGLFYHQDLNDGLRILERPQNIHRFDPGFVIVKLNGGVDRRGRIPETFVTTRLDFWDLASRIPEVLPAAIKQKIADNPLLFLGHGMQATNIESLVRFAHKNHPGQRSWAVVLGLKDTVEYWQQCGVEIIPQDINQFVDRLRLKLAPAAAASPAGKP